MCATRLACLLGLTDPDELENMSHEFDADPSSKETPDGSKEVLSSSHFYTKQLSEEDLPQEGEEEWPDEEEKKPSAKKPVSPLRSFLNNFAARVVLEMNARISLLELTFTTAYPEVEFLLTAHT